MVLEHPFFASLALRLELKEDSSCHTAYTDGRVFGYNPDYIKILPHDKLVGLTAHTVMHPACSHHKRRNNRDPKAWNRACDYVINPILLEAGLTLPDGFLFDEAYAGKSADAVYAALKDGESDAAEEDGNKNLESPDPQRKNDREDREEDSADNTEQEGAEDMPPDSTSGADPGLSGEIRDGDPETVPNGDSRDETDWEQALVQAAANARAMGKLPRGLDLFVEDLVSPKLPWKELMAGFVRQTARWDYTWTQPNRRFIHRDLYFPSLVSDQLAEIAVAVDTSGSIRPEELKAFGAELSAILEMNPAKLHLIYSDMAVNEYQVLAPWDLPVDFSPKGGGGTDFRAVFSFIDRENIRPCCLIFLSDMECRLFPENIPGFPVLWVKVGRGGVTPPFGREIFLDLD